VLVERDELAERARVEPLEQQQRAATIAGIALVRATRGASRIALCKRPGLREAVRGREILLILRAPAGQPSRAAR